jgi:hypothetical protein
MVKTTIDEKRLPQKHLTEMVTMFNRYLILKLVTCPAACYWLEKKLLKPKRILANYDIDSPFKEKVYFQTVLL